jgi:CMP-N-acetylneuraminic acid synthetase
MPDAASSPSPPSRRTPARPSKVVAVIPARGGSVSIPKKNIKPLLGRPLIDWVIRPALDSGVFAEVWVSTDDDVIEREAMECGALVHRRSPQTATATASTESAIKDFVDAHPDYDYVCLIQATSPLITPADFIKGMKLMVDQNADSLVTAVRAHRFLWAVDPLTHFARAKNYEPLRRPRRQDWDGELIENGAFYFFSKGNWEAHACRLGGKTVLLEMEEHTFTELDSLVDWKVVSHMAADYGYFPPGVRRPAAEEAPREGGSQMGRGIVLGATAALLAAAAFTRLTRK